MLQTCKILVYCTICTKESDVGWQLVTYELCRAVDKASPYPPGDNPEDWPKEKRAAQPLVNKLENIIGKLIKLITHPDYKVLKEKFPTPEKEPGIGIYKLNYENPFYEGYIIKINPRDAIRKKTRKSTNLVQIELRILWIIFTIPELCSPIID